MKKKSLSEGLGHTFKALMLGKEWPLRRGVCVLIPLARFRPSLANISEAKYGARAGASWGDGYKSMRKKELRPRTAEPEWLR